LEVSVKLTPNPVKALGIFFGHNKEECKKLNWEKKIPELSSLLPHDTLSDLK
jgi:hypothetical protein